MLSGAIMLSVGGVLAKIFSALYRIILTRILGGDGIGIYQLVFPLYSLCVVLSSAGIPMAISKVIAKNRGCEGAVVKKCLAFCVSISLVLSLLLVLFCKPLANLQGDGGIYVCYLLLAPAIVFVGVISVLRGYFQGKQCYTPTALSNIVEQAAKFVVGIVLTIALIKISLMWAIVGALIAIVASEIVTLIVLLVCVKRSKIRLNCGKNIALKPLVKDILPITLTSAVMPIASFVDSLIVVNLLAVNFTKPHSIYLYGLSTGAVGSLVGLPSIFSFALASVILPNIVGRTGANSQTKLNFVLKLVLMLTLPCVLLFIVAAKPILHILYGNMGIGGISISAKLLIISSIGVMFLAVQQLLSSALQAAEKRRATLINLIIAVILKFVVEIVLMPIKQINIYALAIGNVVCYFAAMLLNFVDIRPVYKFSLGSDYIFKLSLANLVMVVVCVLLLMLGSGTIYGLLTLVVAILTYFITLFEFNILTKKDMAYLKYRV